MGVVLFVAISGELASFLSTEGVERDDLTALVDAETRGDVNGMLHTLSDCARRAGCVVGVRANAAKLRQSGSPKILSIKSSTAYSLAGASGKTRLAWAVLGHPPVVQCVEVRRTGTAVTGIDVALLSLSGPITNNGDC